MSYMVLGLTGQAQAGKDTVADIIRQLYSRSPIDVHKLALADPVKDATAAMFGVNRQLLDTQDGKASYDEEWGLTIREMAQLVGTEVGRNIRSDLWLKRWMMDAERIIADLLTPNLIIVPDVRYLNEAKMLRDHYDTTIVKIVRPDIESEDTHESEQITVVPDETIINDGHVGDLEELVDCLLVDLHHKIKHKLEI
jgi:dephospho-CoA kinase